VLGVVRIDAGEAWCGRARATVWRGGLWCRELLLRAHTSDSFSVGPSGRQVFVVCGGEGVMDVVVERCAGLDVHRDNVVATVRVPGAGRRRWEQQTRTFRATLAGLSDLGAWLSGFAVTLVGMEATGVYWKTVFQALEDRFECWLLNAQHLRNVPGRKTDVKDSEWICQLVQHGLVRPSFVSPPEIRRLRDLTRLRKAQINERGRSIQRLEKVLQDAGIKLTSVASQAYSKSARAMLDALLCGVTNPDELAELAKARMRSKIPQLREALASRFDVAHHGILVAQLLAHIDTLDAAIQTLDERIDMALAPHAQVVERLCTIPGVARRAAPRRAGPDRRMRPGHDALSDRRALRFLGRRMPRPP
jgi:transposase